MDDKLDKSHLEFCKQQGIQHLGVGEVVLWIKFQLIYEPECGLFKEIDEHCAPDSDAGGSRGLFLAPLST